MLEGKAATDSFKFKPPPPPPRTVEQKRKAVLKIIKQMRAADDNFRDAVSYIAREAQVTRPMVRRLLKELGCYVQPRRLV